MSLGIGPHDLDCPCPRCEGRRANARLIAAAPELLEAVEEVLPFMKRFIQHTEANFGMATAEQKKALSDAEAAIRKARGE